MPYYVYILRGSSNKIYIDQTNNLTNREKQQSAKSSKTAKFVKDNDNFKLVYHEIHSTRKEAMRREKQLKGWTRAKKEALIKGNLKLLKKLAKKKIS